MRIGVLSDTHGFVNEQIFKVFENCDEVWHAGDIGNLSVTDSLNAKFKLRAVYGNIDDAKARIVFKEYEFFVIDGKKFLLIHIAGAFEKYNTQTKLLIQQHAPDVLICGHSHICKVAMDTRNKLLYMNPGAAGNHGFHHIRTVLRFEINEGTLKNMEVVELGKRV